MKEILAFVAHNKPICIVAATAAIATMPRELPWPVTKVPILVWVWEWAHDALRTCAPLRIVQAPPPAEKPKP